MDCGLESRAIELGTQPLTSPRAALAKQQWPEMQLGTAVAVGRLLSWALLGGGGAWDLPLGV